MLIDLHEAITNEVANDDEKFQQSTTLAHLHFCISIFVVQQSAAVQQQAVQHNSTFSARLSLGWMGFNIPGRVQRSASA